MNRLQVRQLVRLKKIAQGACIILFLLSTREAVTFASTFPAREVKVDSSLVRDSLKVMVPAYFSPSSSYWNQMEVQAAKMPGRLYAIANVSNGPGSSYLSSYAAGITGMHDSRGKVIGYVYTQYGKRSISSVEADIDSWFSFYPSIDGILFDEQANVSGDESYYAQLYDYVKQKDSSAIVATNPGTNTLESYLFYNGKRIADVICIFENGSGFSAWSPAQWCNKYSRDNFLVVPYNTPASSYQSLVNRAASLNIGWIYCTDATLPNPYSTLPSYFAGLCSYIVTGVDTITSSGGGTSSGTSNLLKINWNNVPTLDSSPNLRPSQSQDPDAQFTNLWAANDANYLYLRYQVADSINFTKYFYHILIDTDNDSVGHQTGFVYDSASIGAEFLVENKQFAQYAGSGGSDWAWTALPSMQQEDSTGWVALSLPLKTLFPNGSGDTIGLIFEANQTASPYSLESTAPDSFQTEKYLYTVNSVSRVERAYPSQPIAFTLLQNYPNPFNPSTNIGFNVPVRSRVEIVVYNVLGQIVSTLVDQTENPGYHTVRFDGSQLPSGVYLCSLHGDGSVQVRKMVLIK